MRCLLLLALVAGCSEQTSFTPIIEGEDPGAISATIHPEEPCSSDELRVDVEGATPVSFAWTLDGRPTPIEVDHVLPEQTLRNQQWGVLVTVDEVEAPLRDSVTINRCPPSVQSVHLEPELPFVVDAIQAFASAEDPDGDPIALTYTFFVDGSEQQSGHEDILPAGIAVKHQSVEVEVQPSSGGQLGEVARSAPVVVQNSPPEAPEASISPEVPFSIHDLHCEPSTPSADDDDDEVSYEITWTVDGTPSTAALTTDWPGDTVPASATEPGQIWECTLTPSDGEAEGPSATASVTIRSGLFPCDGRNMGDDFRPSTTMGGPDLLFGMQYVPPSDLAIGRVEVFTGRLSGPNVVSMYAHDSALNQPDERLSEGTWTSETEETWQGADLDTCVPVKAGETYWVVWEPVNGARATWSVSGEDVTYRGSFDGGGSWNGPFAGPIKYKLYCCE